MATKTTGQTGTAPRLQIRRVYQAPPARLFRAWTTAEEMKKWGAPSDASVALVELDPRVGGRYRIHMRGPDGQDYRVAGTYRVVDPPHTLAFSWKWEHEDVETLVTLEFRPHGAGTELVLTHEGFQTEESRGRHEHGWTSILENLAQAV